MKKALFFLFVFALSYAHAQTSTSTETIKALELCDKKQYQKALPILEKEANKGVIEAQYALGRMYAQGLGVTQDCEKGMDL
jgi:TPR repeat protein